MIQMRGACFEFCAKSQIKTYSDWSKHTFPVFTLAETNSKQIKERQIQNRHHSFVSSQNIIENRSFRHCINLVNFESIWDKTEIVPLNI